MHHCRVCDSTDLDLCIDLGKQPWCNGFISKDEIGKEPIYPLRVVACQKCHTAQLDYTVKKEIMFGDHTYLSGITSSLSNHFRTVAFNAVKEFGARGLARRARILDIGSNDGTQLLHFKELGCECLGVESSSGTARIANQRGIETINRFFNLDCAKSLEGKFDIINAAGVFFHLEELHSVCEGIKLLLDKDGTFIIQFLYMKSIIENGAFDQIYHEHLLYYTVKTVSYLLEQHGLQVYRVSLANIHGGSIIAYASHYGNKEIHPSVEKFLREEELAESNEITTYIKFAQKIEALKLRDLTYLEDCKSRGKNVFGFGAPVKGNTLLNYYGITSREIKYLVEKNPLRRNLYAPGSHIPIIIEDELEQLPDVYYVLAWNFKEEILRNNQDKIASGIEFYFPVDLA
jgi:SAM-dependent methyltransferase